ncbi:MAG: nitrilase family protein [Salinivenus sp.]
MQDLRAAAVQFNHAPGDMSANWDTVHAFVERAAEQEVDLLSFPEMCLPGYWHLRDAPRADLAALSEPIPDGPSTQELLRLAEAHDMTIGAGLIEQAPDGALYNAFVVATPTGEAHVHRKLHCFLNEHLSSGDAFTVFDVPDLGRVGVLTCWDNNLVENARITALKGAELLLAPHQTGGCDSRSPEAMGLIDPALWHNRHEDPEAIEAAFRGPKGRGWLMRWLPARAHDNGMFLVFSNGVGPDDGEVRTGNAMILDPYGRIIEETWKAADKMVVADLDADLLEMCTGQRWLRGRRPELYEALATPTGEELDPREARFKRD